MRGVSTFGVVFLSFLYSIKGLTSLFNLSFTALPTSVVLMHNSTRIAGQLRLLDHDNWSKLLAHIHISILVVHRQ